jgi:hypothetical protein
VWGAAAFAVFLLSFVPDIVALQPLHRILGLGSLAGFVLLSLDPPARTPLQRQLLWTAFGLAVASFLIVMLLEDTQPARSLGRVLAVAVGALPLWLVARQERFLFLAAALLVGLAGWSATLDLYVLSTVGFVAAAVAAGLAAVRLSSPTGKLTPERSPPRIVVASNIVTYTPEQKERLLAELERRYAAGELKEHTYWDRRQEIESR